MKGIKYACFAGIGTVSLLMIAVAYLVIVSYFFVVTHCTFIFDHFPAQHIRQSIISFSNERFLKKSFLKANPVLIQQQFPMIKSVRLDYRDNGLMFCRIRTIDPVLIINNTLCLSDNGELYDKQIFSTKKLADIPSITIQSSENIALCTHFKEYIKRIPLNFFEQFTITWLDHTRILLQDKLWSRCILVAHYQTDFNDIFLQNYTTIKQEIAQRVLSQKKKWIVDVRFKNQIIVAQKNMEMA